MNTLCQIKSTCKRVYAGSGACSRRREQAPDGAQPHKSFLSQRFVRDHLFCITIPSCNRRVSEFALQDHLAHKKQRPPQNLHKALGIVLLQGPRGTLFFMSEVPLWGQAVEGIRLPTERNLIKAFQPQDPTPLTYTLHPTLYTLHPTPHTLLPEPQTLRRQSKGSGSRRSAI